MNNKIKYLSSQMDFQLNHRDEFLKSLEEETKITVMDKTEAMYGDDGTCDVKYCEDHNIPYYQNILLKGTGCIIAVNGNLLFDIKRNPKENTQALSDKFSYALCDYLEQKGLNSVRCDNNDVLVDNFKVASGAEAILPTGLLYICYQISINQDLEVIKHACTKPMIKVPKALSEYGITTEEMIAFSEKFWTIN